jgi:hypothetical protein
VIGLLNATCQATRQTDVMKRALPFLTLILLLAGCVQTQATMLADFDLPPVHPDDVVIYLSESDIVGDWEKIAIIHAQGDSQLTRESNMLRKARERAGEIGANGILIEDIKEPSVGAQIAGEVLGTGSTRRGRMIAIYVTVN